MCRSSSGARTSTDSLHCSGDFNEACKRIEELEAALREIAMLFDSEADEPLDDAIRIARAAIAPEQDR